jgi:transposase
MLALSPQAAIYLAVEPTDMRKGFDGLSRIVAEHIEKNVLDGGLFVFVNRRGDRLKLLWWQEDGLCIWYQRLEAGTFQLPQVAEGAKRVALTPTQLSLILGGIDLRSAKQRRRYQRSA